MQQLLYACSAIVFRGETQPRPGAGCWSKEGCYCRIEGVCLLVPLCPVPRFEQVSWFCQRPSLSKRTSTRRIEAASRPTSNPILHPPPLTPPRAAAMLLRPVRPAALVDSLRGCGLIRRRRLARSTPSPGDAFGPSSATINEDRGRQREEGEMPRRQGCVRSVHVIYMRRDRFYPVDQISGIYGTNKRGGLISVGIT